MTKKDLKKIIKEIIDESDREHIQKSKQEFLNDTEKFITDLKDEFLVFKKMMKDDGFDVK
jgi:hypothetical protein